MSGKAFVQFGGGFGGDSGGEGVVENPVDAFHHAVGLRVVGRGRDVVGANELCNGGEELTGELGASVGRDDGGGAVAANPVVDEVAGDVVGCNRAERDGFDPTGEAVDHGEDVAVPIMRGERAEKVEVDVAVASFWKGELLQLRADVAMDLRGLAGCTLAAPLFDVLLECLPDVSLLE